MTSTQKWDWHEVVCYFIVQCDKLLYCAVCSVINYIKAHKWRCIVCILCIVCTRRCPALLWMHCVWDWHECAAPVIGDWGNGRGRIPLIRRCRKIRFWIMWQIWYLLRWSSLWSEDAAKISILRFLLWLSFVICQGRQRYGANDILLISRFGKIWSALWSLRFDPHYQHSHNFL